MSDKSGPTGDQYYGVLAEAYDAYLTGTDFNDFSVFEAIIKAKGGPALELACGTGRLMLALMQAGHSIEDLDSSDEMLALCDKKAEAIGLGAKPVLHQASMDSFDLGKTFDVIYCPVASFTLLPSFEAMAQGLACIKAHLNAGGTVALNMDGPSTDPAEPGKRKMVREAALPERDITYRCWMEAVDAEIPGTDRSLMINELLEGGEIVRADEAFLTFFRPPATAFADLVREAGFQDIRLTDPQGERPFRDGEDSEYLLVATKP